IRQSLELPAILSITVAEIRGFLETDRVKIYRFDTDGSGEVVAESVDKERLPSLLGQHFPAQDIPHEARELFLLARQRSIVDVGTQQIGLSPAPEADESIELKNDIRFRSVDPCHVEYLTSMGVQSSLVVPILHREQLWGLLVSHHSLPRQVTERELQVVQLVADQLSIAIAQSTLLEQSRLQAQQEATINRVAKLLHSMTQMQVQQAL
ncbi:histidine kinase, partial [Fischerella thermalis CCMEE 5319]